jgi:hypothetical protein
LARFIAVDGSRIDTALPTGLGLGPGASPAVGLAHLLTFYRGSAALLLGALGHGLTLLTGDAATEGLEGLFNL